MSVYKQGGAAFFAQIPTDRTAHWPTTRRDDWLRGWNDARVKAAWAL